MKWLYRLEAVDENNGLWYNSKNEYVWGCILSGCAGAMLVVAALEIINRN